MKIKDIGISSSGTVLPAILFLAVTPYLINGFGLERFGYISLMWAVVSIAGLFDFGLNRSVARYVSEQLRSDCFGREFFYIAIISLLLGGCVALVVFGYFQLFLGQDSSIDVSLREELRIGAWFILFTVPLCTLSAVQRGVFEGRKKFIPPALSKLIASSVMAVLLLYLSSRVPTLWAAAAAIMVSRLLGVIYSGIAASLEFRFNFSSMGGGVVSSVIGYGGWILLSSISGIVLVYADRFVLAAHMSSKSFGEYSLLMDVMSKSLIVAGAVSVVLYPSAVNAAASEVGALIRKSLLIIFVFVGSFCLIMIAFGATIFNVWVGVSDFSIDFRVVLIIFSLGVLVNSVAHVPLAVCQAKGWARVMAKIHLIEVVLYMPMLLFAVEFYGYIGGVFVWFIRMLADSVVLYLLLFRMMRGGSA